MKILVLSNTYPPHFIGGYELACHEVVERLKAAGHEVAVLTSTYGVETSRQWAVGSGQSNAHPPLLPTAHCPLPTEPAVYRLLYYDTVPRVRITSVRGWALMEYRDARTMRRVLAAERPDLIYVWNMGGLTRSLLAVAHAYPAVEHPIRCKSGIERGPLSEQPVVYEIFDNWLAQPPDVYKWAAFWQRPSRHPLKRYLKSPARQIARRMLPIDFPVLDLRHIVFKSQWLKRAALDFGLPVEHAPVIYHGVDRALFHPTSPRLPVSPSPAAHGCRVLYVGQIARHKGVHTLIDAFARLSGAPACAGVSLTIVGGSIHPDYVARLQAAAARHGLGERVRFHDLVPRSDLPAVYREHDALVFPSIWQEPFGLTQIEAMACGLPVIGTGTGGSAEILTEETALRFPPGDAPALADRIHALATDPDRRRRMGEAALRRVADHFDLDHTARQTEEYLERARALPRKPRPDLQWKMPLRREE